VALIPTFRPIWAPAPRTAASRPAARRWRPCCRGPSPWPRTSRVSASVSNRSPVSLVSWAAGGCRCAGVSAAGPDSEGV